MAGKTPQMGGRWLGIWHPQGRYFDSAGLTEAGESGTLLLREANALQLSQVRAVILEDTGDVSVLHGPEEVDDELLEGVRR